MSAIGGELMKSARAMAGLGAEDLLRTCAVVGPAPYVRRVVPVLFKHGMAVEALSVTPFMNNRAGGALAARLSAQDTGDGLRAQLGLYPSAKGCPPLVSMAPESVHSSDDFKYVLIAGPTWWRAELATNSLETGKYVVVAPPTTASEAAELASAGAFLYNDLRCSPAVGTLREIVLGADPDASAAAAAEEGGAAAAEGGALGPLDSLRVELHLSAPLCCTEGLPSEYESSAPDSWWRSRAMGGGALGVAGVQAFELLHFVTGCTARSVRASMELASARDAGVAADHARVEAALEGGASALMTLDWRGEHALGDTPRTPPSLRVAGRDGAVTLDLSSGALELRLDGEDGRQSARELKSGLVRSGEGRDLIDDSHDALVAELMSVQAGDDDDGLCTDWSAAVYESYRAVDACYRSWDESRGEEMCEVA